jgi:intron-binding protein aquarius
VATFMYMRLQGIPASKISIITTYNGQCDLLSDVVAQRCGWSPLFGTPAKIATTDKFQGQQNDYILLSLVRTKAVGHLRDVRRLIVAMSRARVGLYVFGRRALFEPSAELRPTFEQLLALPDKLTLLPAERAPTKRLAGDVPSEGALVVDGLAEMGELVASLTQRAEADRHERELAGLSAAASAPGDAAMHEERPRAAPAAPPVGALGGGPEAPPDMDDDDD